MLTFAYDGSLNGDWVAHYAVRFARNSDTRRLRLVHILEGTPAPMLSERLGRIADECRIFGVELETDSYERGGASVADRILDVVPHGPDTLLVTGTRARPRNMAFLAGTVSARLFAADRFPVVALRVVHPGVLGQPGRLMLPVIDHATSALRALPLLRLFGPDLSRLHVLWIRRMSRFGFRVLTATAAEQALEDARIAAARLEDEIRIQLDVAGCTFDAGAAVTDDWPKETLVAAGKQKSGIICLTAPNDGIPRRLVYGNAIEQVLRSAPCDVAVYRGLG